MGMHVGNTSSSGEPEVMMDINTTPLIDVMLVLLVMLIITIPIQLHSVELEMPVGAPPTNLVKPEKIQIDIDDRSIVHWQGLPVDAGALEQKMSEMSQLPLQPEVHIRPNKDSQYAVFANVLSSSKRLGLNKIAVIGAEQFVQ
ncbi:biopolymer transporter ExbD [Rhodoferax sp.]|uniref:ExbD/TolR family protein n=1 Tax=Rhodoferax sp. TaxID=50421 RepID=UPI002736E4B5|nr:biopolymer transporter ExbD [Rhodoferax sp.]MDP3191628.1 biopolymer transporter ExbD [Rhodoferax sp.]MDP3864785.1 biopolymer transporter ExbD [Rhodoferax sp.]